MTLPYAAPLILTDPAERVVPEPPRPYGVLQPAGLLFFARRLRAYRHAG